MPASSSGIIKVEGHPGVAASGRTPKNHGKADSEKAGES